MRDTIRSLSPWLREGKEIKYEALAMAKEMHGMLSDISFIGMLGIMNPANPAKKDVEEFEARLNDLTRDIGDFIQANIGDATAEEPEAVEPTPEPKKEKDPPEKPEEDPEDEKEPKKGKDVEPEEDPEEPKKKKKKKKPVSEGAFKRFLAEGEEL